MKLCASNIGWLPGDDEYVYRFMSDSGFEGLEIAPSRIFPVTPYEHVREASEFAAKLRADYGLAVVSIQSIWYGMTQRIAGSEHERRGLMEHTRKALRFSDAVSCRNIVFGCPKNRRTDKPGDYEIVAGFLADIADEAEKFGITVALEPNPAMYGTNFINTTAQALELVSEINHPALKVNLDFGTIIANAETLCLVPENISLISHVHISEPELRPIKPRFQHKELRDVLRESGYSGYISLEMRSQESITELTGSMKYIREVFA
ncbi:MAG: sugar phosphate isomerase/epimerase [Synergistaceae bacterium]|nr:sugar phosphate isomerase/epimerase [Synergistaceae bacterium]